MIDTLSVHSISRRNARKRRAQAGQEPRAGTALTQFLLSVTLLQMGYSMRQAAKTLGISNATLSRYISAGKVPAPKGILVGNIEIRSWTDADIEKVRKVLPKSKNGRKMRYQKHRRKQKV